MIVRYTTIIFILFAIALFAVVGGYSMNSVVYAEEGEDSSGYTEEQKAAAKAWLSAHGYPPTRAGAAQAYADYLAGKLDNDPDVRKYEGLDDNSDESDSSNSTLEIDTSESGVHLDDSDDSDGPGDNIKSDNAQNDKSADSSSDSIDFENITYMVDEEQGTSDATDIGSELEESKETLVIPEESSEINLSYTEEKKSHNWFFIIAAIGCIAIVVFAVILLRK